MLHNKKRTSVCPKKNNNNNNSLWKLKKVFVLKQNNYTSLNWQHWSINFKIKHSSLVLIILQVMCIICKIMGCFRREILPKLVENSVFCTVDFFCLCLVMALPVRGQHKLGNSLSSKWQKFGKHGQWSSVKELWFWPAKGSILDTGLQIHERILNRFGLPRRQVLPCKVKHTPARGRGYRHNSFVLQ